MVGDSCHMVIWWSFQATTLGLIFLLGQKALVSDNMFSKKKFRDYLDLLSISVKHKLFFPLHQGVCFSRYGLTWSRVMEGAHIY